MSFIQPYKVGGFLGDFNHDNKRRKPSITSILSIGTGSSNSVTYGLSLNLSGSRWVMVKRPSIRKRCDEDSEK